MCTPQMVQEKHMIWQYPSTDRHGGPGHTQEYVIPRVSNTQMSDGKVYD